MVDPIAYDDSYHWCPTCGDPHTLAAERLKEALGKLDRYRSALERIIETWDGDSESMHDDPAVIAREALSDET